MSKLKLIFILLVCAMPLYGCDTNEGAAERAGERMDNAAENVEEGLEDAADNLEEGAEEACEKLGNEDC